MNEWPATIASLVLIVWCSVAVAALGAVSPEIAQKVQAEGTVRVIVRLDVQISPEGTLSTSETVELQRSAISFAQSFLLAELAGTRHRVTRRFRTIPFLAMEVERDALAVLETSSFVLGVGEDFLAEPSLAQSAPLVEADQAWVAGFDGAGWSVAILDTGVDTLHPFLAGKVVEEACFSLNGNCPDGSTEQIGPGAGLPCTYAVSGCRHGTHVAGIAAGQGDNFSGVGRGADLIAIQVFSRFTGADCSGQGEDPCARAFFSDITAALEHVYGLGASLQIASVNMSLGGGRFTSQESCNATLAATKAAIDNLRSFDIATVASSGNDGFIDALSAPACISTAVSVGATTKSDSIISFSNSASFLSLLAPGVSIFSSLSNGEFGVRSGTSMAAPHVAGAWGILRQASPASTVSDVLNALQSTGLPLTDPRNGVTVSRIQILQALNSIGGPVNLVVSPTIIQAGGTLTAAWNGIAAPTSSDWIGLYQAGAEDTAFMDWVYVSCSKSTASAEASGSCPFVLPGNLAEGTYELRLFADNGFTRLATSNAFSVTTGNGEPILTVSPTSIPAGATVTATWSGIAAPSSSDWIGLFVPGAADTEFIEWLYVSCSKTRGNPQASGSCSFTLPSSLVPGNYELRLLANNGFARVATSNAFTVTAGNGSPSLTVSPSSISAGGTVTASWSGIAAPSLSDWIGLFTPGASDTAFIEWIYVSCSKTRGSPQASGACSFIVPASLGSGDYELRLLANDGFTRLATSNLVTVSSGEVVVSGQARAR
jgi:subtilisin